MIAMKRIQIIDHFTGNSQTLKSLSEMKFYLSQVFIANP